MDKVKKFGTVTSQRLMNRKTNKNNQSGGDNLEELVRSATAKDLRAPDTSLNQKVMVSVGFCREGLQTVAAP